MVKPLRQSEDCTDSALLLIDQFCHQMISVDLADWCLQYSMETVINRQSTQLAAQQGFGKA